MWLTLLVLVLVLALAIWLHILFDRRRRLRCLFIRLIENFEKENVKYWVDFGTLLGICREGDIILGDNDADVCIYDEKENREKIEKVVYSMGGNYLDWGAYRVYDKDLFIDIYIIKENDGMIITPTGEVIEKDVIEPQERKTVKLGKQEIIVCIPKHIHKVLKNRYGDNWHISKRKWYGLYIDFDKDFQ